MKALLKEEGKTLDSYTREELSERFHVVLTPIRKGIRELEQRLKRFSLYGKGDFWARLILGVLAGR